MRVITGLAGGQPLKVPRSLTRPTTDRVREAVFSSLGELVSGARVLDLYAGSGALGIESLSRGAASVLFVEESTTACRIIEENLLSTRLAGGMVRPGRVSQILRSLPSSPGFDLIFADPPYARGPEEREELKTLLETPTLPTLLRPGGCFVLESWSKSRLPPAPVWHSLRERRYGETLVTYLALAKDQVPGEGDSSDSP